MTSLMKSEVRKLLTTRTAPGLAAGAIFVAVLAVLGTGEQAAVELTRPLREQQWFFLSGLLVRIFIVVLGIRIVTDEFQHGTIIPAALVEPRRERLLAAKAATAAVVGLVVAAAAHTVLLAAVWLTAAAHGGSLEVTASDLPVIVGPVIAGALWAVIGVGVGMLVRAQTPAVVGAIVWVLALEDIVGSRLGDAAALLPARAGFTVALPRDGAMLAEYAALFALYALIAAAAGLVLLRRRDLT